MNEEFAKLARIHEQRKEVEDVARAQRYQKQSMARLLRILRKKHQTTFIGDLARFEAHFGHLWGRDKDECDRTMEERAWFDIWQLCRTDILNNGNNQLRAVENELSQYTLTWDRYHLELPVSEDGQRS